MMKVYIVAVGLLFVAHSSKAQSGCPDGFFRVGNSLISNGNFELLPDGPLPTPAGSDLGMWVSGLQCVSTNDKSGDGDVSIQTRSQNWGVVSQRSFPGDPTNDEAPVSNWLYSNRSLDTTSQLIWQQTVVGLHQNERYVFKFYASDAIDPGRTLGGSAQLEVLVNGRSIGTFATPEDNLSDEWHRVLFSFQTLAGEETIQIQVFDRQHHWVDDFAMTALSLHECQPNGFCRVDADCSLDRPACDLQTNRCVRCFEDMHCQDATVCTEDRCIAQECVRDIAASTRACEENRYCDGRGRCSRIDSDMDGVPDDLDADDDNDGICDVDELGGVDLSVDGNENAIADYRDSAVVSCSDGVECETLPRYVDRDRDGVPNHLDLDSDGDGIFDIVEAGHPDADENGDGRVDDVRDVDGDGLVSRFDTNDFDSSTITTKMAPPNHDGDAEPDVYDLDSDHDGLSDSQECPDVPCVDDDEDRFPNFADPDDDGDSILTRVEVADEAHYGVPDSDNTRAYLDRDSDGDGREDRSESGLDLDRDGIPDYLDPDSAPEDRDGDGIPDRIECTLSSCEDSDADGVPDFEDLDSDNDGIADEDECPMPASCRDSDGDGIVDFRDLDSDGDGIRDDEECVGSSKCDHDDDSMPNYLDLDADDDGRPDALEGHNADFDDHSDVMPNGRDADRDGLDDAFDVDQGGRAAALADFDADGAPDFVDPDDDNDGRLTRNECVNRDCDQNRNGAPDYLESPKSIAPTMPTKTNRGAPTGGGIGCSSLGQGDVFSNRLLGIFGMLGLLMTRLRRRGSRNQ